MSIKFFELLERIEKPETRHKLIFLFSNDYYFAKISQLIREGEVRINFTEVVNMFSYYGQSIQYGEDWFEKISLLRDRHPPQNQKKKRIEPMLLYLISVGGRKFKGDKYKLIKELMTHCDELEFRWVVKILCSAQMVRGLLE